MLDFSFTPLQDEYRARLRRFALRELLPGYRERDETRRFPREEIRRAVALAEDFFRGREEAWDLVTVGITAEELARGDLNVVLPSLGRPYQMQFFGELTPEQASRWLPGLFTGDRTVGLAITEAQAGSDMGRLAARAERRGDRYVLHGEKTSVSFLNADFFYVFARTGPESAGWRGISAFLVDRGAPGLSTEVVEDLGCRSIPRGVLRLRDVEVPASDRVGEEGSAFVRISRFFDVNRAVIGLKCIGAALQSLEETVAFARERVVFGAPLSAHQAVSFSLTEAATDLEFARWQCYRVLWQRQRGLPCQGLGAMVKYRAPKRAAEVIHRCLLIHGHRGYSRELPFEQRLRDVVGWQIGDGSEEVMKLLVSRELFRDREARGG